MRRRLSRKEINKQRKILIIGSLSLLLFLCVGYAAFSTNLNLTAKGNIKLSTASEMLRKKCNATSGDGLYEDIYEEGRCIYKGINPNNYITFNNETWRIISLEQDNTIKIIKNDILIDMKFDTHGYRDKDSNGIGGTYCASATWGCNAWSISDNFTNGSNVGTVLKDAELNTYLNNTYLNSIEDKDLIVSHKWNVGFTKNGNYDLKEQILAEKSQVWNGKIGLINSSEYIRTNTNVEKCGDIYQNNNNHETCKNTTWVQNIVSKSEPSFIWTITPNPLLSRDVWLIHDDGNLNSGYATGNIGSVLPSVYLSSDIILSGVGTQTNPYIITN